MELKKIDLSASVLNIIIINAMNVNANIKMKINTILIMMKLKLMKYGIKSINVRKLLKNKKNI